MFIPGSYLRPYGFVSSPYLSGAAPRARVNKESVIEANCTCSVLFSYKQQPLKMPSHRIIIALNAPSPIANAPALSPLSAATPTATRPRPSLYRPDTPIRASPYTCLGAGWTGKPHLPRKPRTSDEDENDGSDGDADSPAYPIHDISYIPNYPSKSMRSRLIRNGGGGNGVLLILDEATHPPIAFSAGLPGGIQLS